MAAKKVDIRTDSPRHRAGQAEYRFLPLLRQLAPAKQSDGYQAGAEQDHRSGYGSAGSGLADDLSNMIATPPGPPLLPPLEVQRVDAGREESGTARQLKVFETAETGIRVPGGMAVHKNVAPEIVGGPLSNDQHQRQDRTQSGRM